MYAAAEYIEIIVIYGECGRNAREAGRQDNRSEIGDGTRDVRPVENEEIVLNTFEENPLQVN
jgi:hypothetical protein